jgi:hypothetical protein
VLLMATRDREIRFAEGLDDGYTEKYKWFLKRLGWPGSAWMKTTNKIEKFHTVEQKESKSNQEEKGIQVTAPGSNVDPLWGTFPYLRVLHIHVEYRR